MNKYRWAGTFCLLILLAAIPSWAKEESIKTEIIWMGEEPKMSMPENDIEADEVNSSKQPSALLEKENKKLYGPRETNTKEAQKFSGRIQGNLN